MLEVFFLLLIFSIELNATNKNASNSNFLEPLLNSFYSTDDFHQTSPPENNFYFKSFFDTNVVNFLKDFNQKAFFNHDFDIFNENDSKLNWFFFDINNDLKLENDLPNNNFSNIKNDNLPQNNVQNISSLKIFKKIFNCFGYDESSTQNCFFELKTKYLFDQKPSNNTQNVFLKSYSNDQDVLSENTNGLDVIDFQKKENNTIFNSDNYNIHSLSDHESENIFSENNINNESNSEFNDTLDELSIIYFSNSLYYVKNNKNKQYIGKIEQLNPLNNDLITNELEKLMSMKIVFGLLNKFYNSDDNINLKKNDIKNFISNGNFKSKLNKFKKVDNSICSYIMDHDNYSLNKKNFLKLQKIDGINKKLSFSDKNNFTNSTVIRDLDFFTKICSQEKFSNIFKTNKFLVSNVLYDALNYSNLSMLRIARLFITDFFRKNDNHVKPFINSLINEKLNFEYFEVNENNQFINQTWSTFSLDIFNFKILKKMMIHGLGSHKKLIDESETLLNKVFNAKSILQQIPYIKKKSINFFNILVQKNLLLEKNFGNKFGLDYMNLNSSDILYDQKNEKNFLALMDNSSSRSKFYFNLSEFTLFFICIYLFFWYCY